MDLNDVMKTFVDQYAPMNPETEFLIPNAKLLQNGMEVLVAEPMYRENKYSIERGEDSGIDHALERNRWCKVSHLAIDYQNKVYTFIATYSDGTQRKRTSGAYWAWLVKLDSVDVLKQKRDAVRDMLDMIAHHDQSACSCEPSAFNDRVVEEFMKIFGMGVQK